MVAHRYMEENDSATMLAIKRPAGVAPEVNLMECTSHIYMPLPSVNRAPHSGFESQRRCHQSKLGVLVATQIELMSSNFF